MSVSWGLRMDAAGAIRVALLCLTVAACGGRYYPVAVTWQAEAGSALTCEQLGAERASSQQIQRQIAEVAANGRTADGVRPQLYTMSRPGADRAVQERLTAIEQALQARNCPGTH